MAGTGSTLQAPARRHNLLLELYENRNLIRQALLGVGDQWIDECLPVFRIAHDTGPVGEGKP